MIVIKSDWRGMAPNTITAKMMMNPKQSDLVNSVTTAKVKNISNNNTSIKNHNSQDIERKPKIVPKPCNGKSQAPTPPSDVRAKKVLKEAVDAVVNSFAKHTQGCYGRGKYLSLLSPPLKYLP